MVHYHFATDVKLSISQVQPKYNISQLNTPVSPVLHHIIRQNHPVNFDRTQDLKDLLGIHTLILM